MAVNDNYCNPSPQGKRNSARVVGCDGETRAARPNGLSGNSFRRSGLVGRAHVGELPEQVFVGPDLILRHLSIAKERKEEIHDVVGECPAVSRVDCRPCGVIGEDVRQQGSCYPRCFRWRISTGVL